MSIDRTSEYPFDIQSYLPYHEGTHTDEYLYKTTIFSSSLKMSTDMSQVGITLLSSS